MNATTKYAFTLLVAALVLLGPAGTCAAMLKGSVSPAHHCCPNPHGNHCAAPMCVCADSTPLPITVPSDTGERQVTALPVTKTLHQTDFGAPELTAPELSVFTPHHRFIALHQFLI
jgi:hypothetical protein